MPSEYRLEVKHNFDKKAGGGDYLWEVKRRGSHSAHARGSNNDLEAARSAGKAALAQARQTEKRRSFL